MQVRNKATVDAPWVCHIHAHYALIAIGVSVHQWNYRCSGLLYISAWGFDVARFDRMGNSYEPQDVERAIVEGFTSFVYVFIEIRLNHTLAVAGVLDRIQKTEVL